LIEDFFKGRCVKPSRPKLVKKPKRVKASECGAAEQRPCKLWERIPSCDQGLVENFLERKCVRPKPGLLGGLTSLAALPSTQSLRKQKHPVIQYLRVTDPKEKARIDRQLKSLIPAKAFTDSKRAAKSEGKVKMVGWEERVHLVVGGAASKTPLPFMETGKIYYPDGTEDIYAMQELTVGLSLGISGHYVWTTIEPSGHTVDFTFLSTEYDYRVVGIDVVGGIGGMFEVLFDKNWKAVGTRGGPGIGLNLSLHYGVIGFYGKEKK